MCGIFGQIGGASSIEETRENITRLFELSSERGNTSAGLAVVTSKKHYLLKKFEVPKKFVKSYEYDEFWSFFEEGKFDGEIKAVIGQCRLPTAGSPADNKFNQPIVSKNFTGLLNGIITEVNGERTSSDEWHSHTEEFKNDSFSFFDALAERLEVESLDFAVRNTFKAIKGSASICIVPNDSTQLALGTNTGSLFFTQTNDRLFYFASEEKFLNELLGDGALVHSVPPKEGVVFDLSHGGARKFSFTQLETKTLLESSQDHGKTVLAHFSSEHLKKCKKCILPETYPYIEFDDEGVCNYCNHYLKQKVHGEEKLLEYLDQFRSSDGSPDCIVGLSGGRDSCYGLYVLKEKYGMNPIAYTFDWGLTTDISRRNQALVCGKLGVEHIIRAPDIIRKRSYVRKNVEAWFKRPHLGMIPLFQAGDKEFYLYGRKLRKERNIDLTVLCSGYQLEQREFMIGFAGVKQPPVRNNHDFYYHPMSTKVKLATSYMLQYLLNPGYLNESLYESLRSFVLSFLQKSNFLYLFHYLPWEENHIEKVLRENLDWESDAKFGTNQWRMGDGQTAFNNYLYYTMTGFSEFDVFRSNQIREGLIDRPTALKLVAEDNVPKFDSISYFCQAIGLSFDEVLSKVNQLPKKYIPELQFEDV